MRSQRTSIRIGRPQRRVGSVHLLLFVSVLANLYLVTSWEPIDAPDAESEGLLAEATVAAASASMAADADSAEAGTAGVEPSSPDASEASSATDGTSTEPAAAAEGGEGAVDGRDSPEADGAQLASVASPVPPRPKGFKTANIRIDGPVSRGFERAIGKEGVRLAMTASRILVWSLSLTKDPRPGDTISVLYSRDDGADGEFTVIALSYKSAKFGRSFRAYRFQPEGRKFPSYFDEEGREVPARLVDGPIAIYEEITSLLGDGRGHQGMDFKAPVGTEIVSPWTGVVKRTNWNTRYNGRSVEIHTADGSRSARFLHLDSVAPGIQANTRVKKGQRLGLTGNTGRSFAPHLHYEMSDAAGRVLNPLEVHEARHARLSADELLRFHEERKRLQAWSSDDGS